MGVLRSYQTRILDEIGSQNSIVILPTGAGKTAIAADLIRRRCETDRKHPGPQQRRVLFLVPKVLLVEQQARAIREWCADSVGVVGEYFGGSTLPWDFQILVSTPKAFLIAQATGHAALTWDQFSLVVFDEVHHVLKDHPYRKIALSMNRVFPPSGGEKRYRSVPKASPQILGLTASLSFAVNQASIQNSYEQITRELSIEKITTASSEELKLGGYHASHAQAELRLQESETAGQEEKSVLTIPEYSSGRATGIVHPVEERKPHLLLPTFWKRVSGEKNTPFCKDLLDCVATVESVAQRLDPGFVGLFTDSAGTASKKTKKMSTWGEYAHKRRGKKADARNASLFALEQWYEALRMLIGSWEEGEEMVVLFLKMMLLCQESCASSSPAKDASSAAGRGSSARNGAGSANFPCLDADLRCGALLAQQPSEIRRKLTEFLARWDDDALYVRCGALAETLVDLKARHGDSSFRGIVFVQQRVTAHLLVDFLEREATTTDSFHAAPLYATSSPATPSLSVSKAFSQQTLEGFASGKVNLLICTTVAEEGMDVPAANCVIRFDPVLNAVSNVQGRGRARQADSSYVVMSQREDRPVATFAEVERVQQQIAASFQPDTARNEQAPTREMDAQRSRERGAREVVSSYRSDSGILGAALQTLNLFAKKTKVDVEEQSCKDPADKEQWMCILGYQSSLRQLRMSGTGETKKDAKRNAAEKMLAALKVELDA